MRLHLLVTLALLGCANVPTAPSETPAAVTAEEMTGLWVLQIRRQEWQPRDLEFVLRIEPGGDGTATLDPVLIGRTTARLVELAADGDRIRFWLHSRMDDHDYRFDARRDGGTLDGVVRWHDGKVEHTEPFTGHRREVRRFDTEIARFPVEEDPRKVGVEPVLLDRLVLGAEAARSDGLLVLADGRLVAARTFGNEDAPTSVGTLSAAIAELAGGQPDVPNGLRLRPSELAALGQALLDGGEWMGERAVPERWMETLAVPAADAAPSPGAGWSIQPDPTDEARAPLGFGHVTEAGEGLLFYPEARLVVVRTMHRVENRYDRRYDRRDEMGWLDEMAEAIAVEKLGRLPPGE
ncbi:MAG: hypothetical protein V4850_24785 [Myxococcota bacterium]